MKRENHSRKWISLPKKSTSMWWSVFPTITNISRMETLTSLSPRWGLSVWSNYCSVLIWNLFRMNCATKPITRRPSSVKLKPWSAFKLWKRLKMPIAAKKTVQSGWSWKSFLWSHQNCVLLFRLMVVALQPPTWTIFIVEWSFVIIVSSVW